MALLAGLLGLALLAGVSIPAYVVGPGESISLADTLTVDGAPAGDVLAGDYLIPTIGLEEASLSDVARSWFDPDLAVYARGGFLPPGTDEDVYVAEQRAKFQQSLALASLASAAAVGADPTALAVSDDRVGGPSAGLVVALAVADVLDPADLARGRLIAATGELDEDGDVVDIGSVDLKIVTAARSGVTLFLLPSAQAAAALDAIPDGSDLRVVGVDSVEEALAVLREE